MNKFKEYYNADSQRNNGRGYTHYLLKWYRKAQFSKNHVVRFCYKKLYKIISNNHGIEIPTSTKIGKGFAIFHPYNITINPNCVIGASLIAEYDSSLASLMKPQVLTRNTLAISLSSVKNAPSELSEPHRTSVSTRFLAHPRLCT